MSSIKNLSALILAYNRFEKFKRCFENLKEQGIKKIFLSIDGPRNEFDMHAQLKIIEFCRNSKFKMDIRINHLEKNFGCRIAPIKGITWFFENNNYGVILEDDVIISNRCIEFFNFLLQDNCGNDKFMSLSSFNEFTNKNVESIYRMPVWRSWGWASWSNQWQFHLEFSKRIRNYNLWQLYNLLPPNFRSIETVEIIKACQLNLLDAWDYEFNFTHIVNRKESLTIGGINSYVYGFDNSATHTFDINNAGIDFNLFSERLIEKNKILKLNNQKIYLTLRKCGFIYSEEKKLLKFLFDFFKSFYFSLIFYLRKIKKNIYKKF